MYPRPLSWHQSQGFWRLYWHDFMTSKQKGSFSVRNYPFLGKKPIVCRKETLKEQPHSDVDQNGAVAYVWLVVLLIPV